jgi:hypothetical protein
MPTEIKGAIELRKALKQFAPDLAKETQKEIAGLLKPITNKARGFVPSSSPLSGWAKPATTGRFPRYSGGDAKRGIGYKTTPSKPNRQGFRALARIVNASAAGAIYETAGRVHPQGRQQAGFIVGSNPNHSNYGKKIISPNKGQGKSPNPNAGRQFVEAINAHGSIKDANNQTGSGRRSRKMKGRAIFRAWAEDGGKTNAAVIKAIENSKVKFYKAVGYN